MLSIGTMSAGQAGYYLGLAREDYYLSGGEPPGVWVGKGADRLGLSGTVEPDQLYNLFDGRSPDGRKNLVQLQSRDDVKGHRPGWDLTFSAPKTVSTLWSQADPEQRLAIQDAHWQAVASALSYVEDSCAACRRGRGGATSERADMVIACFEHSTSRALDPQLHTHALIMNVGFRPDGSTGTLNSLSIFDSKMTAGALYRADLSSRLQDLGLEVVRKQSWFEVSGVSSELSDSFSKRRKDVERELQAKGISSAQASAVAAMESRTTKEVVPRSELFSRWRQEGLDIGWSRKEATSLFAEHVRERESAQIEPHLGRSLETISKSYAHFNERDFIRHTAEECQAGRWRAPEIVESCRRNLENSESIVRLGNLRGTPQFSTVEMLTLEESLFDHAAHLSASDFHSLDPDPVMKKLSSHGELSEEQMKAVWHITVNTGDVALVEGMAGTGKTRMLDVARKAWEEQGFTVKGAAIAARAARELQAGAQIESKTVAKILYDLDQGHATLDAKTILVVDESGMIATPDMERLCAACHTNRSKLVLVGDARQLQPIGPGAPFKELAAKYGSAELVNIRRQDEAWARNVVGDFADGRARDALRELALRGFVSVSDSKDEAMRSMIEKWRSDSLPRQSCLMLAATKADVSRLNRLAQETMRLAGELGSTGIETPDGTMFEGDRLMFSKTSRPRGIDNGARGTIVSADALRATLSVRLDSGDRVTFSTRDFPHFHLGYAGTTHKAQGATSLVSYVLVGGSMQDREMTYVQSSRAKEKTWIFATKSEVGDDIAHLSREMERSRQKNMAHSFMKEWTTSQSHDR